MLHGIVFLIQFGAYPLSSSVVCRLCRLVKFLASRDLVLVKTRGTMIEIGYRTTSPKAVRLDRVIGSH